MKNKTNDAPAPEPLIVAKECAERGCCAHDPRIDGAGVLFHPAAPAPALRRNLHVSPDADDGYTDYAAPAPEPVAWALRGALKNLASGSHDWIQVYNERTKDGDMVPLYTVPLNAAPGYCPHCKQYTIEEPLPAPVAAPAPEPVAWIEHHKAGDNLLWDEPGGKKTALYAHPAPVAAPNFGYATVWHEGSKSFYHAALLRKMSPQEVNAETVAASGGTP